MSTKSKIVEFGGLDIICNSIAVGATKPGQAGTVLAGSELTVLDGVTAGTATASKAIVLGASKEIATITSATITTLTSTAVNTTTVTPTTIAGTPNFSGVATFSANPTFAAGFTLNLDSAPASLTSHAVTVTKYAGVITTEALTTAAGASQAFVITLTGVAAGDLAFIQGTGTGTNTRMNHNFRAATTTNTLTVTVNNNEPTNALNGTLIFNYWIVKA